MFCANHPVLHRSVIISSGLGTPKLHQGTWARQFVSATAFRRLASDVNYFSPDPRLCAAIGVATFSVTCRNARRMVSAVRARSDPGREELIWEWVGSGEKLVDIRLANGGSLQVTAHSSADQTVAPGIPSGAKQEWRVLRFTPDAGTTNLIQSVTKVCISEQEGCKPSIRLRGDTLPLAYTKSLATIVLATLSMLGAPVLRKSSAKVQKDLRILCIGLGGGSVPSFISQFVPHCHVDVVELEQAVVSASSAMGFVNGPMLKVHVQVGAEFALQSTRSQESEVAASSGAYHAVIVDAYDAGGGVPEALWSRGSGMAEALASGLLCSESGLIATNFLPNVDVTQSIDAYRDALKSRHAGIGFSVQATGTGNRVAVQTCGTFRCASVGELSDQLVASASEIQESIQSPFDMVSLVNRNLNMVSP